MPNVIKILRSIVASIRPSGKTYGEPYVNFADNQFGVVDSSNVARDLLGVPVFSSATSYAVGQIVSRQGIAYIAQSAVPVGVWNPAQWSLVASQIAATDFTTGDVKLTIKTVADPNWIMMDDGTIGDATSGAGYANVNAQALFTLIWTNIPDTWAPVTGGRGANAAADWAAHKPIKLPRALGRALAAAGSGAGLSARVLGAFMGEEVHSPTIAEMMGHGHSVTDPGHYHNLSSNANIQASYATFDGGSSYNVSLWGGYFSTTQSQSSGVSVVPYGSSQAFNQMQPTTFLNVMIKL